jgi:Domain of unknown function (DUF4276)
MAKCVIVPIVEGHGEVGAVPILLKSWRRFRRYRNVEVDVAGPVRASGKGSIRRSHDNANELGIEYYVKIALLRRPDVILVLLDADDDCPKTLGPELLARARACIAPCFPIGVVVAKREYEAWFLAAFSSLRFRQELERRRFEPARRSLPPGTNVEEIADCKRYLSGLIGVKYEPAIHQPALTEMLPFSPGMSRRSRSFRKLLKELQSIVVQARRRSSLHGAQKRRHSDS